MSDPADDGNNEDGNIENNIENNCKLVKETIDNLLDAFKMLEMNIDSMAVRDDVEKYQDKMQELRQQNTLLKSQLTSLQEKEFRMAVLLSIHEQNKLKKIEQLRKERIKTKIMNLCRNELGIIEKLDIQRPLRAPNKKEICADVLIEFENEENFIKLLKNITKLTDCKIIVRKHSSKQQLKQKNNNNNKSIENSNDENTKLMGKYVIRIRQEIKQKIEIKNFI